ncbi:hypothetical protein MCCARTNEY_165 [Bacillus phage vB_BanH_McCartney]|nr:hypothetical protein MCCARTNEY_165 [Bacillus phage vB_BanH_McCartney]
MATIFYNYKCESGCGHTTLVDKPYKTKRIFCGVCGYKITMVYKGISKVTAPRMESKLSINNKEEK